MAMACNSTQHNTAGYIAAAPVFARPILQHIRAQFHKACPTIEETIKWGCPHFEHAGLVGGMAAFKNHVTLSFWRGMELRDSHGLFSDVGRSQMTALKLRTMKDLPSQRILVSYIKEAVALNAASRKPSVRTPRKTRAHRAIPQDLAAALARNKTARATFEAFSPSHCNEYIDWITEAKRDDTRARRIATALEWLAAGKPRNWKYSKKSAQRSSQNT